MPYKSRNVTKKRQVTKRDASGTPYLDWEDYTATETYWEADTSSSSSSTDSSWSSYE